MTVAAVILAATVDSALADAAGVPRVRRIADAAWSGGAMPIIVVAPDPDGAVAAALAGTEATLTAPVDPALGPVGQIARGIDVAASLVTGTTAAIIWPARLCWIGPETVTSLVEAHGAHPEALLRPTFRGETGWPALLPLEALPVFRALPTTAMPDELVEAIAPTATLEARRIDLGDPGTVMDGSVPREDLPPYDGPAEPAGEHTHEWGEAVAATADESPMRGAETSEPDGS